MRMPRNDDALGERIRKRGHRPRHRLRAQMPRGKTCAGRPARWRFRTHEWRIRTRPPATIKPSLLRDRGPFRQPICFYRSAIGRSRAVLQGLRPRRSEARTQARPSHLSPPAPPRNGAGERRSKENRVHELCTFRGRLRDLPATHRAAARMPETSAGRWRRPVATRPRRRADRDGDRTQTLAFQQEAEPDPAAAPRQRAPSHAAAGLRPFVRIIFPMSCALPRMYRAWWRSATTCSACGWRTSPRT